MKLRKLASGLAGTLLDTIMPQDCPGCGEPVESGPCRRLCRWCFRSIEWIRRPFCERCGSPLQESAFSTEECLHCRELQPSFAFGRAMFLLTGTGRSFIHGLKYHGDRSLLEDLPGFLDEVPDFKDHLKGAVIVPVPLHRRRLRSRGFNQSEWIAESIAACDDLSAEVQPLLGRVRNTRTQTRLSRPERMENLKNAFALTSGKLFDRCRRIVIVDDVFTTGATLEACACVLLEAGAEQVDVAALGHG